MIIRRWALLAAVPIALACFSYTYRMDQRIKTLEDAPTASAALEKRVADIEKIIAWYEGPDGLRVKRERELADIKADVRNVNKNMEQMRLEMNASFERLFEVRRR